MTIKTEILEWHTDPQDVPEDFRTVSVVYELAGQRCRTEAYRDSGEWCRTRSDGAALIGNVIGWADPKGPTT